MGLFDRFQKREQVLDETHVSDVLLRALLDGEAITREKALTLPAVSGAVDFISNCVASMPVKLFKYKQGKVEAVEDDPRTKILNGDTGDTLDAFQMKKAMVEDYLMGKGGYAYIGRDRNEVTGLFYVEERYVEIFKTYEPIFKHYTILVMGKSYQPWDFIKLLRNTKDGASGVGLTVEVSKALETAYNSMLYQLGMVKSGGSKKGFLKSQRKLGQEEIDVLKAAWRKLYEGNSENVVVLNNGLEFQEASSSSLEMQMNESKRTFADEINDLFHISNDFELTFKLAIYPIIKAFETALNRDLLLEKEKKNYFFEFDIKEIIKASLATRYQAYKTAKETGFMTINEIRRAENMNYVEGLDVVNVGLGAVLFDVNSHTYYTPNTNTVGDPNNPENPDQENPDQENMDKMLEGHELVEAYDESGNSAERSINERFNDVHDAKTGRFGVKSGSGGGAASAEKEAKISELEAQLAEAKGLFAKAKIKNQIDMIKDDFNGTVAEYLQMKKEQQDKAFEDSRRKQAEEKAKAEAEAEAKRKQLEDELKTQPIEKVEQYKIIQQYNPMYDDYHTGIRKPSDIKTWQEAINEADDVGAFVWGDFTKADAEKALKSGKITIYSSYPIKQGVFVSTSKIQSQEYAGGAGKKLYSKTIPLTEVAWISGDEGQYAKRELEERFIDVHDPKTGRFGVKSGSGAWGSTVSSMRDEFNGLKNNEKALFLWENEFLNQEDALKAMKDGSVNKYGDEYFKIIEENGDYNPTKQTADNKNRAKELIDSGKYTDWNDARKAVLKEETGFSDDEVEKTHKELNTWFGDNWEKANTETIDKYVEKAPAYNGEMWRGLHFDTPEEANAFLSQAEVGSRIKSNGKNSSWTSDEAMGRHYAHTVDDGANSVVIKCLKNKTSVPVATHSTHGSEEEVLASSKAEWTVLRKEVFENKQGNKKAFIYVVEADKS